MSHTVRVGMDLMTCNLCGIRMTRTSGFPAWCEYMCSARRNGADVEQTVPDLPYDLPYPPGLQEDGSVTLGHHACCMQVLTSVTEGVPLALFDFVLSIPTHVRFEGTDVEDHAELWGTHVRHLPNPRSGSYVYADPMGASWEDMPAYETEWVPQDRRIESSRSFQDDLFKLPGEVIRGILDFLPTPAIGILRRVSVAASRVDLPPAFWRERISLDLPWLRFVKGSVVKDPEVQYRHLKQILRRGEGPVVKSLRNLDRIYRSACRFDEILSSRTELGRANGPTAPREKVPWSGSFSLPLRAPSLRLTLMNIGRSSFITGFLLEDDQGAGFKYGEWHYQLPLSDSFNHLLLAGYENGFVGLGFSDGQGHEVFAGRKDEPNTSAGRIPFTRGDELLVQFDGFKLSGIQIKKCRLPGNPPAAHDMSPLPPTQLSVRDWPVMWIPSPLPSLDGYMMNESFFLDQLDREEEKFGPVHRVSICECHDSEEEISCDLVQINAFFIYPKYGLTGLEFLRTNAHRVLVFTNDHLRKAVTAPADFQDACIVGLYGILRGLEYPSDGLTSLQALGYITRKPGSSSSAPPQFVSKAVDAPRIVTIPCPGWCIDPDYYGLSLSAAYVSGVKTISLALNPMSGRILGMKWYYAASATTLPRILGDYVAGADDWKSNGKVGSDSSQHVHFAPGEHMISIRYTARYEPPPSEEFWDIRGLRCLEIRTSAGRLIELGNCSGELDPVRHVDDGGQGKVSTF
ncbi:MAG: hypothetical protein M1819_003002 [Sarea resinae]|nr:MAG: hypothetical protein M1819_003002 [Sarea resinae]